MHELDDSLRWPEDDAYFPYIDRHWLGLLSRSICATTCATGLHRGFTVLTYRLLLVRIAA